MSLSKICAATLVAVGLSLAAAAPARAALVNWDVDAAQSFSRITVPDFAYDTGTILGTITIRPRNVGGGTWTDAGGRKSALDGTITTNLVDGSSVQFLSGLSDLFAVDATNARPNPAVFVPSSPGSSEGTYSNNSQAPAAIFAQINTSSFLASTLGFMAMRDIQFDLASGAIALSGGTGIAASSTSLGVTSAQVGLDVTAALVTSSLPDQLLTLDTPLYTNTSSGSITIVDFLTRKLTLTVSIPLDIDLGGGVILPAAIAGQIVAYATLVPEPSTIAMAGVAALGLCFAGRRRFRRS